MRAKQVWEEKERVWVAAGWEEEERAWVLAGWEEEKRAWVTGRKRSRPGGRGAGLGGGRPGGRGAGLGGDRRRKRSRPGGRAAGLGGDRLGGKGAGLEEEEWAWVAAGREEEERTWVATGREEEEQAWVAAGREEEERTWVTTGREKPDSHHLQDRRSSQTWQRSELRNRLGTRLSGWRFSGGGRDRWTSWTRKSIRQAGEGVASVPQGDGSETDDCGDPSAEEDIMTEHRAIAVKRTMSLKNQCKGNPGSTEALCHVYQSVLPNYLCQMKKYVFLEKV
nr:ATP-dependent RNA helicase dbp2-like [Paramormyrops kingsleyae]